MLVRSQPSDTRLGPVTFKDHPYKVDVKVGKDSLTFCVAKRPYVTEILEELSDTVELCIYTAARQEYAETVLEGLDLFHYFARGFYRDTCVALPKPQSGYMKPLGVLGRDMDSVLLVDDSQTAVDQHPLNCLSVPAWVGDPLDDTLLGVVSVIRGLRGVKDVRNLTRLRTLTHVEVTNLYEPPAGDPAYFTTEGGQGTPPQSGRKSGLTRRMVSSASKSVPPKKSSKFGKSSLSGSTTAANSSAGDETEDWCLPYTPPPARMSTAWLSRAMETLVSSNVAAAQRTMRVLQGSGGVAMYSDILNSIGDTVTQLKSTLMDAGNADEGQVLVGTGVNIDAGKKRGGASAPASSRVPPASAPPYH